MHALNHLDMRRIILFLIASSFISSALAQIPKTLSFQGYVTTKTTGEPLVDAGYDMTFSIWDGLTGATKLWEEFHTGVVVTKGLYTVLLGDAGIPINLPFDKVYYLQVKIGLETLDPRVTLSSSAYSISSINAANITSGIIDNARLDTDLQDLADGSLTGAKVIPDFAAQNIVTTGSLTAVSLSGALPTSNLTGTIAIANGGTGGTTQSTARSGLGLGSLAVLNTISSSEITDLSIATADLGDGSVTSSKLSSTAVTAGSYGNSNQVGAFTVDAQGRVTAASNVTITGAAPTGLAGGDLTGNFPDPIIGSGVVTSSKLAASSVSGGTGGVILDNTIVNDDIFVTAAIADTKLATISTTGKVSNSATTATNTNTSSTIVARDASGNFNAGTITANLNGNASTVTTNANLTGDVTSVGNATAIASGVIVDADINGSAAIADSKLATISSSGKVSNSATTATNLNTANTIVTRDASGNFSAGTITAALDGNAATVSTNANLAGDVTSVGNTTTIAAGVIVNADINASANIADTKLNTISSSGKVSNSATTATNLNTASAIVARDASGNFSAGTITATLSGNASTVTTNANLTGDVTSVGNATVITAGVIVDADISGSATIADTKLATISTAGKVSGNAITSGTIGGTTAIGTSGTLTSTAYLGATGGVHVGNTTAPTVGNLEVDGFSKLGTTSPSIKVLKLTGTTNASANSSTNIAHGLTAAKILSVSVMVEYATDNFVTQGFDNSFGYFYNVSVTPSQVVITNVDKAVVGYDGVYPSTSSANIRSRPIRIIIIYEQ